MYYAIMDNEIAIGDKTTLEKYYKNISELPADYYERTYVVRNGELVVDESAEKTKAIEELDAQYNAEVARLSNEFNSAQLRGDNEVMNALKEEMTSLDAWYDEEYNKIIGGYE